MASETTAAEQTAGGSNAAAAGGAGLLANRTRNIGSGQAAAAAGNRAAGESLSQTNAGIQNQNTALKESQRQAGLSGEGALYGEDVGAGENALGLSNSSLKDAGSLSNYWQDLLMQGIKSGTSVATAGLSSRGGE